jgi:cytochrome c oxidase cbb3-type subunit 3
MSEENNTPNNDHLSEEDKAVLLDHNYDGIQEFDYPLPSWWVMTFVLTCLFGIPYIIYYNFMDGPSLRDEMNSNLTEINKVRQAYAVSLIKFDTAKYNGLKSAGGVEKGAEVYEENCMSCHEEGGKGDIGPNLTDAYWIHARGTEDTIYEVVLNGRDEKGMPAWGEDLTSDEIYQVVSYVMSLKNTNVPGGKEPQGEKVE